MDFEFHTQLQLFQEHRPNLIPANIDIRVDYSVYRSLRRGSTSREGELGVPDPIVDLRRGDCTPYRQVWCGKCYTPHHTLKFFVENPENEFGAVWEKKEDMNRFVCGRSGDSLTFPFQCDTCWFRILEGRFPETGSCVHLEDLKRRGIRRLEQQQCKEQKSCMPAMKHKRSLIVKLMMIHPCLR